MTEAMRLGVVDVPEIEVPFSVEGGVHAGEAQAEHLRWADRYEVFVSERERRIFAAMDIGALASLLLPEAETAAEVQLVADFSCWLLLRDDRWDASDEPEQWERLARRDRSYLRLMRRTEPAGRATEEDGDDSLYHALADLCLRLRTSARRNSLPDPIDGRFVAMMKRFFLASVREIEFQRREQPPSLPEYIEVRSATGGLDILTFVQAASDGVRLPGGLFTDPLYERLTEASENICCWHNDLVSLNKELASGEVHNLVLALLKDRGSLEEAVQAAERMIYEQLDSFVGLERQAAGSRGKLSYSLKWYARTLRNRIGGIIVWQEACAARYQQLAAVHL